MDPELLPALKALSDASRLRVVGLLAAGHALTAEALAEALGLTVGTVVHHLARLREAGLVSTQPRLPSAVHELRLDRLAGIGRELDRLDRQAAEAVVQPPGPDAARLPASEARVLRAFLVDGRLVSIPAQLRKRQVILRFLASTDFQPGEAWPEKEVNMRLALRHPDVAALRRYLVDDGYMERAAGIYRLRPEDGWPPMEATGRD